MLWQHSPARQLLSAILLLGRFSLPRMCRILTNYMSVSENVLIVVNLLPLFQRQNANDGTGSLLSQSIPSSILLLCISLFTACGSGGDPELGNALEFKDGAELSNAVELRDALNLGDALQKAPRAGTVSLAWNPVADPSVRGYFVYYGTSSPNSFGSCAYQAKHFTSTSSITVRGLTPGMQYYFAVSAFNGLESTCSAEVSTIVRSG